MSEKQEMSADVEMALERADAALAAAKFNDPRTPAEVQAFLDRANEAENAMRALAEVVGKEAAWPGSMLDKPRDDRPEKPEQFE